MKKLIIAAIFILLAIKANAQWELGKIKGNTVYRVVSPKTLRKYKNVTDRRLSKNIGTSEFYMVPSPNENKNEGYLLLIKDKSQVSEFVRHLDKYYTIFFNNDKGDLIECEFQLSMVKPDGMTMFIMEKSNSISHRALTEFLLENKGRVAGMVWRKDTHLRIVFEFSNRLFVESRTAFRKNHNYSY